ncbi:conserved hypothetical protein [Xanthomonas oryzae pv. oryzae KACC 10331]|uniref:Lipoprotein n=1 Tax=Xanthomonas oryzae pv. oryzae (strain KACC10331 / KXO85) TaxID=291331 RepID=Q5H3P5_XANOR|nr:conserved hypothetical protein [Xanthomonas oryzae pv. oryzae KACC 10331]
MIGRHHLRRAAIGMLASLALLVCAPAGAVTRAWLDREQRQCRRCGDVEYRNRPNAASTRITHHCAAISR